MLEERFFHKIIKELCLEMNIKMEKLSYDWVVQLSKDGKVRHITRNHLDLNPQATGEIADDKYATYEVLKSQNVPVIEHTMIFNPAMRNQYIGEEGVWSTVISEFSKHGCLVVKPNNGCQGQDVSLCYTLKETEAAIQNIFRKQTMASICPYYDIKTEYRTFYLNGEVLLIYGKTKPFVIGDGKSALGDLIEKLNLPEKKIIQDNLSTIDMDYVPKDKEKVDISWKHNLSGGATPTILDKGELYSKIESLAVQAGKAMNINFATIDIIQTTDNNLYVMEVNSGVCGKIFTELVDGGYEMLKDIYRKALQALFN